MAKYNSRRSGPEWLRLITECCQSGMPDNVWRLLCYYMEVLLRTTGIINIPYIKEYLEFLLCRRQQSGTLLNSFI